MSGFLLWIVMTVAIVYAMPAAWAVEALSSRTAGRVQLAHVRGLWHRGSGILVLSSGAGGADAVHWAQRIQWDVALLRVPTQWALRVTWPEVGPPFRVTLQAGLASWAATIAPWQGMIPLAAVGGLGAPLNTLALEGSAQIKLPALQFSSTATAPRNPTADVEITFSQLRSALAQGVVLGDYVVRGQVEAMNSASGGVYSVRTVQGALLVDGTGLCRVQNRLVCHFEGGARAARHDDALLGNLLGLLGKPQAQSNGTPPVTELRW